MPELTAVDICNHSGRHTAGDGDHDADPWGPCSQCEHYARVVNYLLADRASDGLAERVRALACQWEAWDGFAEDNYGEKGWGREFGRAMLRALLDEDPTP